eukprot:PLAT11980.1.p2 GENE.PLAT11980.1~~PLAT11980.1.p2  ORF type:complete len:374 (+),score=110.25 PLAT11980.1:69-1190(+)
MKTAAFLVLLLAASVSAHVKLYANQAYTIRNANGAGGDGRFSVNGPCGGANTFGTNGVTTVTGGDVIDLTINYGTGANGDHRSNANAFQVAWVENYDDGAGQNQMRGKFLQGTETVPAPAGARPAKYTTKVTIPNKDCQKCVLSFLDQRNWGGCIDFTVNQAAPPPAPEPEPTPPPPAGTPQPDPVDTTPGINEPVTAPPAGNDGLTAEAKGGTENYPRNPSPGVPIINAQGNLANGPSAAGQQQDGTLDNTGTTGAAAGGSNAGIVVGCIVAALVVIGLLMYASSRRSAAPPARAAYAGAPAPAAGYGGYEMQSYGAPAAPAAYGSAPGYGPGYGAPAPGYGAPAAAPAGYGSYGAYGAAPAGGYGAPAGSW